MKIGELADRTGVTVKTIRYYESIDLLPEVERTASGYRSYGEDAVERLGFILEAKAAGLSLAEIRSVLELKGAGASTCRHTRELLRRHVAEIDERMRALTEARVALVGLAERAEALDPSECVDPNRCQVIAASAAAD
ncbi:MAG: heavy metal-responsive transcriptional regulator [Actinomycetota bacterium]|nr:heavy metal-responsive transcriptional regulator [Actinomycetota bacterium]